MTLKSLLLISIFTFGLNSFAGDVIYISAGSGYGGISKTKPELANELSGGATLWAELDASTNGFIGPHYTYRKSYAENNQVELSITTHEAGVTAMLPLPICDFFLSVGGIWGGAQAEDKSTGLEDRKNILGYYARSGLDLYFYKNLGIRGSFQSTTITMKDFSPTDDLTVSQNIFNVGLVFRGID